jgi:hypothetical protein
MELTQLQWQNIGKKFTPISWQVNIWSASWNQIQNVWLPSNAAQINVQNWNAEIQQMHPSSPVFVNWNQIKKISPVNFWDTISVWTWNNVVLWAHPKWKNLDAKQIWTHLEWLNFSWDQIADLTNRIFDFHWNQAIHKKIIFLIWFLSILLIWIIFSYLQLMWIWEKIEKEKKILDWKLIEINDQLESASKILWKNLVLEEEWNQDCDPDFEDCDVNINSWSEKSLFVQIWELNSNISKLESSQKKAIAEMKKVAENPKEEIIKVNEEKKWEEENNDENIQKNTDLINQLIVDFKEVIRDLKLEIKSNSELKNDVEDDLKDFKKVSEAFNSDKNVLNEENKIRDNKIKELQQDVEKLEKKDDNIDTELKKIQEEINSLELKIKNLK